MGCELTGDKNRQWFLGRKDSGMGLNPGEGDVKAGCSPCLTPTLQAEVSPQRLGYGGGGEGIPQALGLTRLGAQALPPSRRPLLCQSSGALRPTWRGLPAHPL